MNESGFLVYKCRRCGELSKNTSVPNGTIALTTIAATGNVPKQWGDSATMTSVHGCKDGGIGVSDLIGFESDELIKSKTHTTFSEQYLDGELFNNYNYEAVDCTESNKIVQNISFMKKIIKI